MIDHCNQCRIGQLHPISTPYLTKLNGHMMIVPDSPAYHCDMCGQVHYDAQFLENIQELVDQFTRMPLSSKTFHQLSFGDIVDQTPVSTRRSS